MNKVNTTHTPNLINSLVGEASEAIEEASRRKCWIAWSFDHGGRLQLQLRVGQYEYYTTQSIDIDDLLMATPQEIAAFVADAHRRWGNNKPLGSHGSCFDVTSALAQACADEEGLNIPRVFFGEIHTYQGW